MEQNKRGVSDVVTTVLIIMLTVAAIGVIAGFVVPFVRDSLQKSTECMDYQGFYIFDETFKLNCYSDNLYAFSIHAEADEDLAENVVGMKFILTKSDGTTKSAEIRNGSTNNEVIMYDGSETLVLPGPGGIESYKYNATQKDSFESAEIYPILKNDRICTDIKESIEMKPCGE